MTQQIIARALGVACLAAVPCTADDLEERVEHRFAENDGVNIHFVTLAGEEGEAEKPLVVFIHGFPDYWYTWRHQMEALADAYQVVAIDQRGYNKSDKPEGVQSYAMRHLIGDVVAVIRSMGRERAIIVGHDWGAAVAWQFAMNVPQMTERLVIISVPHPSGFSRELATNTEQQKNSQYARDFQKEGAHLSLTAEGLAGWVRDGTAREKYVEAFKRSDFEAMLNYYKANYPRSLPANAEAAPAASAASWPIIEVPVLVIHGLQDKALNARGHGNCWEWIDADTTLVMLPDAGHFVQQDEPERVSQILRGWLDD